MTVRTWPPTGAFASAVPALEQTGGPVLPRDWPFGPNYWLSRPFTRGAPRAANSDAVRDELRRQVDSFNGKAGQPDTGVAAFNVWKYGLNAYFAGDTVEPVDVLWDDIFPWGDGRGSATIGKGHNPTGLQAYNLYGRDGKNNRDGRYPLDPSQPKGPGNGYDTVRHPGGKLAGVRLPPDATPSAGTDAQITLYDRVADSSWSGWKVVRDADGVWSAVWCGTIAGVSRSVGRMDWGSVSASGLNGDGGAIWLDDVIAGRADHGFVIATIAAGARHSWPAQQHDGYGTNLITEGQAFGLDMTRDEFDAWDARIRPHPICRMVTDSAQRGYPILPVDRGGTVGFGAQAAVGERWAGDRDVWHRLLVDPRTGRETPTYAVMRGFPWDRLFALPMDYGRNGETDWSIGRVGRP